MVNIQTAPTALYRLYDADGRLLYVGITNMPNVRWAAHSLKPWWRNVARKDVSWFDDRPEAARHEVLAIRNEQPLHNSMHASYKRKGPAPGQLQIADDGTAEVSMTDARAFLTRLIRTVREGGRVGAFTERGERRAYLVTPDFYDRAVKALAEHPDA